ncbi:recombinase family protein [Nocardia terpenica]|nr:recombinase family protein [Nocardia terpenica]
MSAPVSLRALVGARVSVLKGDEKVSHIAQTKTGTDWAESRGHTVVGTFEDLDVSADKYTPFERPDLGKWLTYERSHEWDILVFSKIDRAFRSTRHMLKLAEWCEERKKILVFAEDGLTLNYRNPEPGLEGMMAELFVYIGSFFAQIELNRFKTRAKGAHGIVRQTDRWATGVPRLGFQTAPHPSGKGRCLVHCPDGQKTLHLIKDRLFEGVSWTGIVQELNRIGELTNLDRSRLARGLPRKTEMPWTSATLVNLMTSHGTQGIKVDAKGNPILTADGSMIRMVDPSFTDDDWERIQQEVEKRTNSGKKRQNSENPVLGVGFCYRCKGQLTQHHPNERNHYFRCTSVVQRKTGQNCSVLVREDLLLKKLEEEFLSHYGPRQVTRRVVIPGSDNRAELERVKESIQRLRDESDAGLIVTDEDKTQYLTRLQGLTARRAALEASPVTAPRMVEETTGETNSEAWARLDWPGRREMLKDAGIKLFVKSKSEMKLLDFMDTEEGYDEWLQSVSSVKSGDLSPL